MKFKVGDTIKKFDYRIKNNSFRYGTILSIQKDSYYRVKWIAQVYPGVKKTLLYNHPYSLITASTGKRMEPYTISIAELFEIKKQLGD